MVDNELIERAAEIIRSKGKVVAFSGAGISKESGVSTYREPGGLWDRFPEGSSGGILAVLANHPEQGREIFLGFLETIKQAKPNPGHLALVDLEKMGYLNAVVTQNVDNLHIEAGNSHVFELHGNLMRLKCLTCGQRRKYEREEFFTMMKGIVGNMGRVTMEDIFSQLPGCSCGGNSRLDFVGFGESVQQLDEAISQAQTCNVMLILGTSGVVYPAATVPVVAKSKGAFVIEINPSRTDLTGQADIFLQGQTGEVLPQIVDCLNNKNQQ
jgi:NAD-dependent deacetylase